jgi:hypothetical protein
MEKSEFSLEKLMEFLRNRKAALQHRIDLDEGGGLMGRVESHREIKYILEAIERGEFQKDPL